MIIYYLLSRKICIRNVRQRNRCNFANLFRSKIQSLYIVQARTVQLNSNAIEKKKGRKGSHVIACKHIQHLMVSQSSWTNDRTLDKLCHLLRMQRELPDGESSPRFRFLLRAVHSMREIAPSRTKRNGLR